MATQQPWWVISVSTFNGKPWQAITFQGDQSAAQSASQGGILAGPFKSEALAAIWGKAWSAKNHHLFTDNPNLSSGNPLTSIPASAAQISNSAVHSIPGVGSVDDALNWIKANADTIFIRIGEVTIGVLLVYVGVKAMVSPAGQDVGKRTFKQTAKAGKQFVTGRRYKAYKTVRGK